MLNVFDETTKHYILIYNLIMLNYCVINLFTIVFAWQKTSQHVLKHWHIFF